MPLITLTRVADDHRTFTTPNGNFAAFKVWEGDKEAEVVTKAETLEKRLGQFRSFVGKPTELILEEQGTWPDGSAKPPKLKIPQQQSQGKRDYVPRWTDTEAGAKWADDRIDRRRALELAVTFVGDGMAAGAANTRVIAESFYRFLKSADVEPDPAPSTEGPEGRSQGVGKAEADGSADSRSGEVRGDADPTREGAGVRGEGTSAPSDTAGVPDAPVGAGEVSTPSSAPSPDEEEQKKDFRAYLAQRYGTAQALLMARELFQTKAREVKNMTKLDLAELQAIDTEFKQRAVEVPV